MSVQNEIDNIINACQMISVQDFVQISNFHEKSGFYNIEEKNKIGIKGHFITSPEISSIFGTAMFNQFIDKNPNIQKIHLLELGPGNGYLTYDILEQMNNNGIEVLSITLLEKSSYFTNQLERLNKLEKFSIITDIENFHIDDEEIVFIYSNEFLDAFGHKQYIYKNDHFYEIFVTKEEDHYALRTISAIHSEYIKKDYEFINFKDNDILEHSPLIDFFIQNLCRTINKFYFATNDYGYTEHSKKSSLRALREHNKINLFESFERVDYSFSVDFNRLIKLFLPYKGEVITQFDFIKKYASSFFNNSVEADSKIIKDLLTGNKKDQMGLIFKNFNVKNYD
jgi:SAM-dependent MidA family methyltransferase|tara:strand:- start:1001 stop:2017 length:1017 start_codon:yes stop_codon:yes gene_type:complete